MRVLSMIFGLLRTIGRFSSNMEAPLISNIYPLPFSVLPENNQKQNLGAAKKTAMYVLLQSLFSTIDILDYQPTPLIGFGASILSVSSRIAIATFHRDTAAVSQL